jgi:hypothetical protein
MSQHASIPVPDQIDGEHVDSTWAPTCVQQIVSPKTFGVHRHLDHHLTSLASKTCVEDNVVPQEPPQFNMELR